MSVVVSLLACGLIGQASASMPSPAERDARIAATDGIVLAGTFSPGAPGGRRPAVLLLGPAGPNDRDMTFATHKAFRVWATHLTGAGFAVLRLDDRGVGDSGGAWQDTGYQQLAADALSAVRWLAAQPEVDADRIALVGLSEGAAIAMLAAAGSTDVGAVVLLSPPGVPGDRALASTLDRTLAMTGIAGERAQDVRREFARFIALSRAAAANPAGLSPLAEFLSGPGQMLVPPYAFVPRDPAERARLFAGDWYQSQLNWDPADPAARIRVPVLVVGGGRDRVLPLAEHHPPLRALLEPTTQFLVFNTLSHLLQPAVTGLPQEYAGIAVTVAPEALAAVSAWLTTVEWPAAR
jgi:uncharacterized protein